jgi:hypothetical protein
LRYYAQARSQRLVIIYEGMTSPPEESSPSSLSAMVQPSATLIEALHHKLCDPSIVPNFERFRAPHVTQRLLTSRWVLQSNNDNIAAQSSSSEIDNGGPTTTSATQNNHDTKKYNQVPTRNYLDIRIQQNTTFANEQCLRCQKKLAVLSSSTTTKRNSIDYVKNRKQIKKITDTIQSHLNEGLAACPNHDGLMKVDLELKCLVDRMNGVDDNIIDNSSSSSAAAALVDSTTAAVMPRRSSNDNIMGTIDLPATTTNTQQISRAQAAINDALVEKMMFSQNDTVGTNNNNDDGNDVRWVPPTSNGDKEVRHGKRDSHSDDSDGKKRNEGHKRRRNRHQSRSRSRSADRHEQDDVDRGRKRKHGSHRRRDERKKRKRRYRSRSPQSSAESLSSRSISRERSKRKHRRDRHSHKRRRHKSSRGKEKKKSSSKRRHRSRRERSTSFSSSSSSSSKSVDDNIGRRFEPPTTLSQPSQQSLGEKTKEDFGLRFEPPPDNKASSGEKLSGASRRQLAFIPPSRSDKTGSERFVPKKSG